MHFLIFWVGLATTTFGLLALANDEDGSGAIIVGVLIMLITGLWIYSITSKAKSDSGTITSSVKEPERPIAPSPKSNLDNYEDEDEDEDTLDIEPVFIPEIRTRTNPSVPGIKYADRYAGRERPFTSTEDQLLLDLYEEGLNIVSIANRMVIDQKQIAIRLIRLLLDPADVIEDEESAENNRRSYKKGEKDEIEAEYRMGKNIDKIAHEHGRTVLAIGWQLLERPSRPLIH